jgi:alpha-L-fucosidase
MDEQQTWADLDGHATPAWFRDATFGVYFHWGPYSVPAYGSEWYPRNMYREGADAFEHHRETYGDQREVGYHDFVPDFTGADFDAERWVDLCAEAGASFVGVTAIHHDGFAMWDSELTDWNAAERGPERDVVGELAAAARDRGLKFVAAFHHAWNWWYYPRDEAYHTTDPEYADLYGPPHGAGEDPPESYYADWRDKTLEVVDEYRPDLLWFDFGWGLDQFVEHDRYRREVVAGYYDRAEAWGKEVGVAHKRNLPVGVGILDYERSRREDVAEEPWLTDTSVDRASWGYVTDADYKSPRTLVTGFVDRVSKHGRTLMNVGPKPDGTIPEGAVDRLRAFGDWFEANREALDGARPWRTFGEGPTEVTAGEFEEASAVEFTADDVRFTRAGGRAYAFLMDWPADGVAEIETSLHHRLTGRDDGHGGDPVEPETVELVGADASLDWELDDGVLRVHLPDERPSALDYAYGLRITT